MADTDHYTPRIGMRAEVAAYVKANLLALAKSIGLTEADLDALIAQGEAAREADRQQRIQLAALEAERTERSLTAEDIFEREEQMRDRLLAIINELLTSNRALGLWLKALSFSRYRMREIAVSEEELAANPDAKKVERVAREDIPTRLESLAKFCTSILEPGREPVVDAFAARELPREAIQALGTEAAALAKRGRNVPKPVEATEREAAAVKAVREQWAILRRLFRSLAKRANDPELKRLLAQC